MVRLLALAASIMFFWINTGVAQQASSWLQIEAQPTLNEAQFRAQAYASTLPEVNGFSLGGGWYTIALGPYTADQAEALRREYRRSGAIPRDSFVSDGRNYGQQFWPVGGAVARLPQPVAPADPATPAIDSVPVIDTTPEPEPVFIDETPREARASEALLNRDERKELQVALKWAGVYTSGIDGAFGAGTRNAMGAWQREQGFDITGVLTTHQRTELFRQYNAVFDGLGLEYAVDTETGVAMDLPLGAVALDGYSAPFARFTPTGPLPAQVILISQTGDRGTLGGLYEIMQTLEIIPTDGERSLKNDHFVIEGRNDAIVSYTQATHEDGEIKGFSLIWPAGDEARRTRVLERMQNSFERVDGVLSAALSLDEAQSIDLVSGLAVRQPEFSRSGLWADAQGRVVTLAAGLETCGRITLESDYTAQLVAIDGETGLALLVPDAALRPAGHAVLQQVVPRLKSEIALAGYSYGGVLGAPSVTFGTVADTRSLNGDDRLMRLGATITAADAGGPVLDMSGAVLGLALGPQDGARALPDGVTFALKEAVIEAFLTAQGVSANTTDEVGRMDAEDLRLVASDLTALVECWGN